MSIWMEDDAYQALLKHEETIKGISDANEDTTRMRAIDVILFDVLRWDRLSVETEKYVIREGYADYVFNPTEQKNLVLEAKRSGQFFLLHGRKYTDRPVSFSLIAHESQDAANALRQAAGYASTLGTRYIAITNGLQWILSLTYVPGEDLQARQVFVFESLEAIKERFQTFWACFSPNTIMANWPSTKLLVQRRAPAPAKLSKHISNYPVPASRNLLLNKLGPITQFVWETMGQREMDPAFLGECYVAPRSSSEHMALVKEMLLQRRAIDEKQEYEIVNPSATASIVTGKSPERPVVILGRIGHGKTTFIRNFRNVEANGALARYIQIDVDFLDRPDTPSQVPNHIYDTIDAQLQEEYSIDLMEDSLVRGVLRPDIQRFQRSPEGKAFERNSREYKERELDYLASIRTDRHLYMKRVFHHLRAGREHSIAIFLDNLDRQSDSMQEEAFTRASAMARDWEVLVFVCLRPGTYQRSVANGVLDAVAPKVVSITPPPAFVVLRRRFEFAAKLASGNIKWDAWSSVEFKRNTPADMADVTTFFQSCRESCRRNSPLAVLFESVSNGNLRSLLRYFRDIMVSQHLDTHEIVTKQRDKGSYYISEHQALRALLYGHSIHYDPDHSVFVNLFDIDSCDPIEHFSRLFALDYLHRTSTDSRQDPYTPLQNATSYLCSVGYSLEHADHALKYLYERNCIESPEFGASWSSAIESVRITALGRYHVSKLVKKFVYLDAISIDTPILDDVSRRHLKDIFEIRDRLIRARDLLIYLNSAADHLTDVDAKRTWNTIHEALANDITDIESGLKN